MRYDSEGDELDEDDEDSEADAAAAAENPFSEIALESEVFCFISTPWGLPANQSLPLIFRLSLPSKTPVRTPYPSFSVARLYVKGAAAHDAGNRSQTPSRKSTALAGQESAPAVFGRQFLDAIWCRGDV